MRPLECVLGCLVGCLTLVACRGDTVGLASNDATGGGAPPATGGQTSSSLGGSDNGSVTGGTNAAGGTSGAPSVTGGTQATGGASGAPSDVCSVPACIPSVLLEGDPVYRSTNRAAAVLDAGRIYVGLQVVDIPISSLWRKLWVTEVEVPSGGSHVISDPDVEFISILADFGPVASDASHVYWFARRPNAAQEIDLTTITLRRTAKDNGTPEDLLVVPTATSTIESGSPMAMAVDDTYVYWTSREQGVYRYPKQGGGGSSPELVKAATNVHQPLALAGDYLYWATMDTGDISQRGIGARTLGDEVLLSSGQIRQYADLCDFVPGGADLYFAQCDPPYQMRRVDLAGTETPLSSAPQDTRLTDRTQGSLALDAENIYFLGSQYLHRAPRGGGPPTAIAQSANASALLQGTHVIGVDDQAVYLLCEATGGILRAAKRGPD